MKNQIPIRPSTPRLSGRSLAASVRAAMKLPQVTMPSITSVIRDNSAPETAAAGAVRLLQVESPLSSSQTPQAVVAQNLIAVGSGKGGVGKTFFSISLCQALASHNARVLLFDGDLGLANIDVQLGMTIRNDLSRIISGRSTMAQAVARYDEGKFDIIAGNSGGGSLASLSPTRIAMLGKDLVAFCANYDHVVLDLGAGVDRMVRLLASHAARRLVVVTPEPTSITDAYAFIKLVAFDNPEAQIEVVVNQVRSLLEGKKTFGAIEKACQTFLNLKLNLAGIVRRDRRVNESIRAQVPILTKFPGADAAIDIIAIANRLRSQD